MKELTASQRHLIDILTNIMPITSWAVADAIISKRINQLLNESECDQQKVFTDLKLCQEILNRVPDLSGTINVAANLEFVYTLIRLGVEAEQISFSSPDPRKRDTALKLFGVGAVYKYNNILGDDEDMPIFDVVVANPPYKKGNEKGGKRALWRSFVQAAHDDMLRPGGYLAFITPHLSHGAADLGHIFTQSQTLVVFPDVSHYFAGEAATRATAYIVHKVPYTKPTWFPETDKYVDLRTVPGSSLPDICSISVLHAVFSISNKIKVLMDGTYKSSWLKDTHDRHHLYQVNEDDHHPFRIRHASNNFVCFGSVEPENYDNIKVAWTLSGYPNYQVFEEPIGTCYQMSCYVLVNDLTEGHLLIDLYNSKLYRFVLQVSRRGGMAHVSEYYLPALHYRSWTDNELYDHFNLTPEEIKLIEATVK